MENRVSPERFIRAWQTSNSILQVAKSLKIPKKAVIHKSNYLKKKGVPLKRFSTAKKTDYGALAKLAVQIKEEHDRQVEKNLHAFDSLKRELKQSAEGNNGR